MKHRLDRLWIVLTMLMGLAHADTLDDFTNNLVSDLGPILALFGERVTMQFMSESLGFSDCVVLAMAPLGIITIIVSAIRVGGPARLKAIIGRASENKSAAEMEVMSSTSSEVCEMFNGQGIVRCQGSAPVWEYICLVPSERTDEQLAGGKIIFKTLKDAVEEKLLHAETKDVPGQAVDDSGATDVPNGDAEKASQPPSYLNYINIIVIRNAIDEAPNISLNLSNHHKRGFIRGAAAFGLMLQLGVLAFFAVITYHPRIRLDFKKDDNPAPESACPLAAGGTILLVAGMLLCAHVVESSTRETRYTVNGSGSHEMHLFWLQQKQTVSDQVFESFAIQPISCSASFITSHRDDDDAKKTREGALRVKTILGVAMGLAGFFCQFVGLRQMNSAASLAQLIAVCIMTILRAFSRRGVEKSLRPHKLLPGFELDWFAWKLLQMRPARHRQSTMRKRSEPQKTRDEAGKRHKAPGWWTINNLWTDERPPHRFQAPKESSQRLRAPRNLVRVRREIGKLANHKAKSSEISLNLATAMEKTLNLLFPPGDEWETSFVWGIDVYRKNLSRSESKFQIKLRYDRDLGSWNVRADDLDAVLSLWTYTLRSSEAELVTWHEMPGLDQAEARNNDDEWFRSKSHPRSTTIRALGPIYNRTSVAQHMEWWASTAWDTTLKIIEGKELLQSSTGAFAQHSSIWLRRIEGLPRWEGLQELQYLALHLNRSLRKVLGFETLLSDLENLYDYHGRDAQLLAYLKRDRGELAGSNPEGLEDSRSETSIDGQNEEPVSEGKDKHVQRQIAPRWLRKPHPWQVWHTKSRTIPLRSLPRSLPGKAVPECLNMTTSHLGHLEPRLRMDLKAPYLFSSDLSLDPQARDINGSSPLHYASAAGASFVAMFLLNRGADPGATNLRGYTPTHYAFAHRRTKPNIIDALCLMNADKEVEDNKERTPLILAGQRGNREAAMRLIRGGANYAQLELHATAEFLTSLK
ncbi:ankyrin repeat protein [Colletotrichum musicola]|uniref:Ankyrin repeat protein n=1 Tax=Colletotrichum musicola TaxID=2175873 RepID=A0A8H6MW71_9PEZI|nr:ankyrin repeat protein [Colletotrichum musicola]